MRRIFSHYTIARLTSGGLETRLTKRRPPGHSGAQRLDLLGPQERPAGRDQQQSAAPLLDSRNDYLVVRTPWYFFVLSGASRTGVPTQPQCRAENAKGNSA